MKTHVKPWTDSKGRMLSDDNLRIKSKGWSAEIWEEYLTTIEAKSSGRTYKPEIYEGFCEELMESIFSVVTNEDSSILKNKIEDAMSELPKRQQEVLQLLFWEGKSQNQIAKDWGVQQSSVFNLKERALNNLRISMESLQGAVNSRFMRGQENSRYHGSDGIQSDIEEVMNAEINRNATHESHWKKNI